MEMSRRNVIAAGAALTLGAANRAAAAGQGTTVRFPKNFLWGTAISAHQSEGNKTNKDACVR